MGEEYWLITWATVGDGPTTEAINFGVEEAFAIWKQSESRMTGARALLFAMPITKEQYSAYEALGMG